MNSDETLVPGSGGSGHGAPERAGDQVGPYRLLSPLGEGGFGTVWLAERRQPFVQRVALKIVKAGTDFKAVVARFEQERQALAVVNHPHVAKVLDVGLTPQGRPYFAMEFVKGSPITEFWDGRKLPVKNSVSQSLALSAKRIIDIIAAILIAIASLPIVAIAMLGILLEDGGPVFFRQPRAGRLGKTFLLLKFRSMRVNVPAPKEVGQVHAGHPYVTRVGHWLRRSKIDELPQLWNVICGDMSLVGPRPALPTDVEGYDVYAHRRLDVRPGMTGWAQVNGNVQLPWSDRIALDLWYIRNWSLGLDLRILSRTLRVVFRGERVEAEAVRIAVADAAAPGRVL